MTDMFSARTRRRGPNGGRRHRETPSSARKEAMGASNDEIRAFEQGPFPAIEIPPMDPLLLTLVERQTGRPVDVAVLEAYERARAFRGYQGPVLTSQQLFQRCLGDLLPAELSPEDKRPRPRPGSSEVLETHEAPADLLADDDPYDLGD